jgi:hypothetical protein
LNIRCSNRWAKPVLPGRLVLGADVIPDAHGDDRRFAVLVHDDAQAVVQRELLERNIELGVGSRGGGGEGAEQRQQQGEPPRDRASHWVRHPGSPLG